MASASGAALPARRHDRPGERMLAVGLDRGREAQHRVVVAVDRAATSCTVGRPSVRVPVLSNSTASTVRMRSRASRSFTRMPLRADIAVDRAITSGIARPSAWGHAITSTVTVLSIAWSMSSASVHAMNVMMPAPSAA